LEPKNQRVKSYTRQYKLRKDEVQEAGRQIKQLESKGLVVKNDDCSFNNPMFMVRKKDNSMSLVVDLHRINQLLKPLVIALPKIDDLL